MNRCDLTYMYTHFLSAMIYIHLSKWTFCLELFKMPPSKALVWEIMNKKPFVGFFSNPGQNPLHVLRAGQKAQTRLAKNVFLVSNFMYHLICSIHFQDRGHLSRGFPYKDGF